MDLNGVLQYLATTVPLGYWLLPYAGDALVQLALIDDEEDEQSSDEED